MIRLLLRVAAFLFAVSVMSQPLLAQRAGVVLALPASARAAGAGDASALARGAGALFYGAQNLPGELAAEVSAGAWVGGSQLSTLAVSIPAWRGSLLALGVQSLDYGSVDEIVPDPSTGGTRGTPTGNRVSASELAVTAGLAAHLRQTRLGFSVSYLHQQVADLSGSSAAVSLGLGTVVRGWDLEAAEQHMGQPLRVGGSSSSLVWTQRVSAMTPSWRLGVSRWQGVAEWRTVRGEGSVALLGVEGGVESRSGWRLTARGAIAAPSVQTARDPWSAGGSAARGDWSLDYAFQGFGALGAVHRMGVTWHSHGPQNPSR